MIKKTNKTKKTATKTKRKATKKDKTTSLVVVVDRSGSMDSLKNEAETGLNEYLKNQKKIKGTCNLTLIQFDNIIETVVEDKDLKSFDKYFLNPRGTTALNDAVATGITKAQSLDGDIKIFVVVTDGLENASREYTLDKVQTMVKDLEAKGWQMVFIGQGLNASLQGATLGFNPSNILRTGLDEGDTKAFYNALSANTISMRSGTSSVMSWSDEQRKAVDKQS